MKFYNSKSACHGKAHDKKATIVEKQGSTERVEKEDGEGVAAQAGVKRAGGAGRAGVKG